ncbi:hypothetical protein ACH43Y_14215 [Streptomyces rubiginosohelvolus]|uniref:hypothetical protein n=1 Tax=Streptomyces rubiginosohelvolus TaxID=67362 RepID=UPI0037971B21
MTNQPTRPAMTMREIRERLGHATPGLPDIDVTVTRIEVSLLPEGDINRKYYRLFVERTVRGTWTVHDGHGGYDIDGVWAPGLAVAHEFDDSEDAVALAKRLAPNVTVNGLTAADAYRRSHPTP